MHKKILKVCFYLILININISRQTIALERGELVPEEVQSEIELVKDGILRRVPLIDGRLNFLSKRSLSEKIKALKSIDNEEFRKQLYVIYEKGFLPLVPYYKETDSKITALTPDNSQTKGDIYDSDELIGDDIFAALLNEQHELVVSGKIYKYTADGIYTIDSKKVGNLYKYLEERSDIKDYPSEQFPCKPLKMKSFIINNDIALFRSCESESRGKSNSPESESYFSDTYKIKRRLQNEDSIVHEPVSIEPDIITGGGLEGDSGSNTADWESYLDSIDYCSPSSNLLGNAIICKSNFSGKYRIKTKFWNENYLVYKSIGVKIKHQKRGWTGLWRAQKTDELRLGINQAYFEYDIPIPQHSYDALANLSYVHNGFKYNGYGQLLGSANGMTPMIPFNTNNFDTIYIYVKLPLFGIVGDNITSDTVNSLLWSQLWDQAKNIARSNNQNNLQSAIITGITQETVVISYVDKSYRALDTKKIVKTFDWQIGLSLNFGLNDDGSVSVSPTMPSLLDYNNIKIDIYGLGRRGSVWRGSKLKYK
jgi:hypothetical protein